MTLELYIAFIVSKGLQHTVTLKDVLRDFALMEEFATYAEKKKGYTFNDVTLQYLREGKKINAIKEVRLTHPDKLGLKEAKDLVDKFVEDHPDQYNVSQSGFRH